MLDRKNGLTIRGLETVRRDWCDVARELQHDVIRLVLTGKEKEAVAIVKKTIEKVKKRDVGLNDIAIRTQLGKQLNEYKQKAPHIAVARQLQKEGHIIRQGTVVSYIITTGKGSISDRAKSIDMVTKNDYDVNYYVNNQIIAVAFRVLSVLGYNEDDFTQDGFHKFMK